MRHLCPVFKVTMIQVKVSSSVTFRDLGFTARSWGLCHSKLFYIKHFKFQIQQPSKKF